METISNWYANLDPTLRVYWTIAIITSLVFAIQMILTIVGIGDTDSDVDFGGVDGGADVDFATDGNGETLDTGGAIQLFTVRNVVNFLLGIGWGGVCLFKAIPNHIMLAIAAILCGCAFVGAFLFMFRQLMKLEKNGNFNIKECVGITCSVYLRIPARREGVGKVQLSYHGSILEIAALTDGELLPSGSKVRVLQVIDGETLLVEALTPKSAVEE